MTPALFQKGKKADQGLTRMLLVLAIVVALILIYRYIIKPMRDKADSQPVGTTTDGSGSSAALPKAPKLPRLGNTATLKRGTKAQEVQWVQYYYNKHYVPKLGGTKLVEDGIFGAKTEAAVKKVTGYITTNWNNFQYAVDKAKAGGSSSGSNSTLISAALTNPSALNDGWSTAPSDQSVSWNNYQGWIN